MAKRNDDEVWALCRVPRDLLFRLRYTLEAYEGLCLSTTAPGGEGYVWLRTSRELRLSLEETLTALAHEMDLQVLGWGSGKPALLPDEPAPSTDRH